MTEVQSQEPSNSKWKRWLKKVGFWGFMFFLVKGLVWVAIFVYTYYWASKK